MASLLPHQTSSLGLQLPRAAISRPTLLVRSAAARWSNGPGQGARSMGASDTPNAKGREPIQGPPLPPQGASVQIEAWTRIPREIKAEHVHAAIAEIERNGVPPSRQSTRYHLMYHGRRYPPKYVVSLAARHATGQALPSNQFSGGSETNEFLRDLGFDIARKVEDPAALRTPT